MLDAMSLRLSTPGVSRVNPPPLSCVPFSPQSRGSSSGRQLSPGLNAQRSMKCGGSSGSVETSWDAFRERFGVWALSTILRRGRALGGAFTEAGFALLGGCLVARAGRSESKPVLVAKRRRERPYTPDLNAHAEGRVKAGLCVYTVARGRNARKVQLVVKLVMRAVAVRVEANVAGDEGVTRNPIYTVLHSVGIIVSRNDVVLRAATFSTSSAK
jgi:hypothetical protein